MNGKRSTVISVVLGLILALVVGPAAALGLGQIRVYSEVNEPLLAEISIISSDSRELEQLQARLASPETFRRIGLQPPDGVLTELRFAVALDAQGRPVVRVTSIEPIRQPLLTFLIEVDWGQGRLVREYSALLDAPDAAAAPIQPAIEAPVAAPDNRITRLPQASEAETAPLPQQASESEVEPLPPASVPEPTPASVPTPEPAAPEPEPTSAPSPAPAPQQVAAPVAAASAAPSDDYSVRRGDTLSKIAASLNLDGDYTLDQTMLALLRSNPEAFIDGNINLVKAGAVLRMPEQGELGRLDRAEAAAVVRAQVRSWRQARQAQPQPVQAGAVAANGDNPNSDASGGNAGDADVRLEIVPPSGGDTPGTQSGLSAGGEGEMLRTQAALQEELASRNAEVDELRARVAELEDLQQKQHQLIELKDSKLAAVEQSLAEVRADAGQNPATAQTQPDARQQAGIAPWLIGGGIVLLLAALVWWLLRHRRRPVTATPRTPAQRIPPKRGYDSAALAAGMPTPAKTATPNTAGPGTPTTAVVPTAKTSPSSSPLPQASSKPADMATSAPAASSTGSTTPAPTATPPPASVSVDDATAPKLELESEPEPESAAPPWHAGETPLPATPDAPATGKPVLRDNLALAKAYIDLGDESTARGLLREVMTDPDPAVRKEATRLLRDLD